MTGLIGKKIGMSQLFDDTGNVVPVTVVETGPCVVVQKKDVAKDGYNALQLGFGTQKNQRVNRPLRGHMAKAEKGSFRVLREFRVDDVSGYEVGQELTVTDLVSPETWWTHRTSKGRLAGVMKRWASTVFRGPTASRIFRPAAPSATVRNPARCSRAREGRHLGNERVSIQNLQVLSFSRRAPSSVKGAIPGRNGGMVLVRRAVKG